MNHVCPSTHSNNVLYLLNELFLKINEVTTPTPEMSAIIHDLQQTVLNMRARRFSNLFDELRAYSKAMCRETSKNVELSFTGNDVEIDTSFITELKTILQNMIDNAIIHGIESSEIRHSLCKDVCGSIVIKSSSDDQTITISVTDDGHGIDVVALRNRALDCGIITSEQAVTLDGSDSMALLFIPGLTTSNVRTDHVGGGLALCSALNIITKFGGTLQVMSTLGQGSTFIIKLPTTFSGVYNALHNIQQDENS